ncbi:MAG TPA: aspartate carbamoyltransferase catalytic subunit [Terriglobales bacterium]|nr:aspartate carbamoyltransferase catalytic subunit [Terriglobales bacterium]
MPLPDQPHAPHLLGIEPLPLSRIEAILDRAAEFQRQPPPRTLAGKRLLLLFYEASTRTRTSFEVAARRLGAETVSVTPGSSSIEKGESLLDTVYTLRAMAIDGIVVRHSSSGAPHLVAAHVDVPVINAGDGMHEHPTQALLDAFTIRRHRGTIAGLRVAIIGDVLHSRVARSNLLLLSRLGAEVRLCGPRTLLPPEFAAYGARVRLGWDLEDALNGADVVMVLRIQMERMKESFFPSEAEYVARYSVTPARMRAARPDAIVMHPGPMIRGVEISAEVADSPQSVIREQVENGVLIRMAVLHELLVCHEPHP